MRKVLIVGGGHLQVPAVNSAKVLGLYSIVTDRNPNCPCATLADEFHELDIYDTLFHVALAREIEGLAGVFTTACNAVLTVSLAAGAAGLPCLPWHIADTCADKRATRRGLEGNVCQPQFRIVAKIEDARQAVKELGPSIIKATWGAGGRGHTFVDTPEDVTPEVCARALGHSAGGPILVEERLYGLELSVETLWHNGRMYPLNVVERPFAHRFLSDLARYTDTPCLKTLQHAPPDGRQILANWDLPLEVADRYAIELGHLNPAVLPWGRWAQIWNTMERAGHAIGMQNEKGGHILKGDLIWCDDGRMAVLELAPRLSGNWDSGATSPLAHGVDYTTAAMALACGEGPMWELLLPRWKRHAACLFKFAEPGRITEIWEPSSLPADFIRRAPPQGIVWRFQCGDTVPELDSYSALVAWSIAEGSNRREAVTLAYGMMGDVQIKTEQEVK